MNEEEKEQIINLLQSADFEKCDKNQLMTIINLFDMLKIPMKVK